MAGGAGRRPDRKAEGGVALGDLVDDGDLSSGARNLTGEQW